MTQRATVLSVKNGIASILIERFEACAGCHEGGEGCTGCGILSEDGGNVMRAEAVNEAGAGPGDHVIVESPDGLVAGAAFLVYMAPLLAAMLGFALAYALWRNGLAGGAGALVVAGGYLAALKAAIYPRVRKRAMPRIVRVMEPGSQR